MLKNSKLVNQLSALGWNTLQSKIYLATLEVGNAPASAIASCASENRVTTYDILKKLIQKGAISKGMHKGVAHFSAVNPQSVIYSAKQKIERLEELLPVLEKIHSLHSLTPSVQVFQGIEGIKQAYMQTLSASGEIMSFANSQNIRDHWIDYDEEYVSRRAEKKIYLRGIAPCDRAGKKVHNDDSLYHREIRLLPKKLFPPDSIENEINLWDNTVMIASFTADPFAFVIQSSAFFTTQKQIFEILWHI